MAMQGGWQSARPRRGYNNTSNYNTDTSYTNNNHNNDYGMSSRQCGPSNHTYSSYYNTGGPHSGGGGDYSLGMTYQDKGHRGSAAPDMQGAGGAVNMHEGLLPSPAPHPLALGCSNSSNIITGMRPQGNTDAYTAMPAAAPRRLDHNSIGSGAAYMSHYSAAQAHVEQQQQQQQTSSMWQPRLEAMAQGSSGQWPTITTAAAAATSTTTHMSNKMMSHGRTDHGCDDGRYGGAQTKVMMTPHYTSAYAYHDHREHEVEQCNDEAAAISPGPYMSYTNNTNTNNIYTYSDASYAVHRVSPYTTTTATNTTVAAAAMSVPCGAAEVHSAATMQPTATTAAATTQVGMYGNSSSSEALVQPALSITTDAHASHSTSTLNNNNNSSSSHNHSHTTPRPHMQSGCDHHHHTSSMQPNGSCTGGSSTSNTNNCRWEAGNAAWRSACEPTQPQYYYNTGAEQQQQQRQPHLTASAASSNNNNNRLMAARRQARSFAASYTAQPAAMNWASTAQPPFPPSQHETQPTTTAAVAVTETAAATGQEGAAAASMTELSEATMNALNASLGSAEQEYVMIRPQVLQMLLRQHGYCSPLPPSVYTGPSYNSNNNNNSNISNTAAAGMCDEVDRTCTAAAAPCLPASSAFAADHYTQPQAQNTNNATMMPAHASPSTANSHRPSAPYLSAEVASLPHFTASPNDSSTAAESMTEWMLWSQALHGPAMHQRHRSGSASRGAEEAAATANGSGNKARGSSTTTATTSTTTTTTAAATTGVASCGAAQRGQADTHAAQNTLGGPAAMPDTPLPSQDMPACPALPQPTLSSAAAAAIQREGREYTTGTCEPTAAAAAATAVIHTQAPSPHMYYDDMHACKSSGNNNNKTSEGAMSRAEAELQRQLAALRFRAMTDTSSSTHRSHRTARSPTAASVVHPVQTSTAAVGVSMTAAKTSNSIHAASQLHTQRPAAQAQPTTITTTTTAAAAIHTASCATGTTSYMRPTHGSSSGSRSTNYSGAYNNINNTTGSSIISRGYRYHHISSSVVGSSQHVVHNTSSSSSGHHYHHHSSSSNSHRITSHSQPHVRTAAAASSALQPSTTTTIVMAAAHSHKSNANNTTLITPSPQALLSSCSPASSLLRLQQPQQPQQEEIVRGVVRRVSARHSAGGTGLGLPRHLLPSSSSPSASSHMLLLLSPPHTHTHALPHHHTDGSISNSIGSHAMALHMAGVQEQAVQKAINGTRYTIGGWYEGVVKRYNPLRGFGFVTGKFVLHYDPQHCEAVCLRDAKAVLAQQQHQQTQQQQQGETEEAAEAGAARNAEGEQQQQQQQGGSDGGDNEGTGQSSTDDGSHSNTTSSTTSNVVVSGKAVHDQDSAEAGQGSDVHDKAETHVSQSNSHSTSSGSDAAAADASATKSTTHTSHASASPAGTPLPTSITATTSTSHATAAAAAGERGGGAEAERADGMVVLSTMQWYLAHLDQGGQEVQAHEDEEEEKEGSETVMREHHRRRPSAQLRRTPIDIGDIFVHHSCISLSGFRVLPVNTVVRFSVAVLMNTVQAVDVIPLGPQWPLPSSSLLLPLLSQVQPCVPHGAATETNKDDDDDGGGWACAAQGMREPPAYVLPEAAAMVWRHHHSSTAESNSSNNSTSTPDNDNEDSTHHTSNTSTSISNASKSVCERRLSWADMAVVPSAAVPNALEARSTMHVVHLVRAAPSASAAATRPAAPPEAYGDTNTGDDGSRQAKGSVLQRVSTSSPHSPQHNNRTTTQRRTTTAASSPSSSVTSPDAPVVAVAAHATAAVRLHHCSHASQPAGMRDMAEEEEQQEKGQQQHTKDDEKREMEEGNRHTPHRITGTSNSRTRHEDEDAEGVRAVRTTWTVSSASPPCAHNAVADMPHHTPRPALPALPQAASHSSPHAPPPLLPLQQVNAPCADQTMTCKTAEEEGEEHNTAASPPPPPPPPSSRLPFSTAIHARVTTHRTVLTTTTTTTASDAAQHTTHDAPNAQGTTEQAGDMRTTKGLHGGRTTSTSNTTHHNGDGDGGGTNTTTTMRGGALSSTQQDTSCSGVRPHRTHAHRTRHEDANDGDGEDDDNECVQTQTGTTTMTRNSSPQTGGGSAEMRVEQGSKDEEEEQDNSSNHDDDEDNRACARDRQKQKATTKGGGREEADTSRAAMRPAMNKEDRHQHKQCSRCNNNNNEGNDAGDEEDGGGADRQDTRHAVHTFPDTQAMAAEHRGEGGNDNISTGHKHGQPHTHQQQQQQKHQEVEEDVVMRELGHDRTAAAAATKTKKTAGRKAAATDASTQDTKTAATHMPTTQTAIHNTAATTTTMITYAAVDQRKADTIDAAASHPPTPHDHTASHTTLPSPSQKVLQQQQQQQQQQQAAVPTSHAQPTDPGTPALLSPVLPPTLPLALAPLQVATSVEATGTLSQPATPSRRVPPQSAQAALTGRHNNNDDNDDDDDEEEDEKNKEEQRRVLPSSSSSPSSPISLVHSSQAALLHLVTPLTERSITKTADHPEHKNKEKNNNSSSVAHLRVAAHVVHASSSSSSSSSASPLHRRRLSQEQVEEMEEEEEETEEKTPTEAASMSNGSGTNRSGETQLGSNPNSSPDWTEVFDQKIANERMKDMLFHKQALKSFPQYNNNNNNNNVTADDDDARDVPHEGEEGEQQQQPQQASSSSRMEPRDEGRVCLQQQQQQPPVQQPRVQDTDDAARDARDAGQAERQRKKRKTAAAMVQTDTRRGAKQQQQPIRDAEGEEGSCKAQNAVPPSPSHAQGNTRPAQETRHASGTAAAATKRKAATATERADDHTTQPVPAHTLSHTPTHTAAVAAAMGQEDMTGVRWPTTAHKTGHTTTRAAAAAAAITHVVPSHRDPQAGTQTTAAAAAHASFPYNTHSITTTTITYASPAAADIHTHLSNNNNNNRCADAMCAADAMASLCVIAIDKLPPSLAAQVPAGVSCIALPRATVQALGLLAADNHNNHHNNDLHTSEEEDEKEDVVVAGVCEAQAACAMAAKGNNEEEGQQQQRQCVHETRPLSVQAVCDTRHDVTALHEADLREVHSHSKEQQGSNNNTHTAAALVSLDEAATPCSEVLAAAGAQVQASQPSSQGSSPDMLLFLSPTHMQQQQQQEQREKEGRGLQQQQQYGECHTMWAQANTLSSSHTCSHQPQMHFASSASWCSEQDAMQPSPTGVMEQQPH